jgi:hypothetical protein
MVIAKYYGNATACTMRAMAGACAAKKTPGKAGVFHFGMPARLRRICRGSA